MLSAVQITFKNLHFLKFKFKFSRRLNLVRIEFIFYHLKLTTLPKFYELLIFHNKHIFNLSFKVYAKWQFFSFTGMYLLTGCNIDALD